MLLAIDVYYIEDKAKIVGVLFNGWQDQTPQKIIVAYKDQIAPYQSGQFYQRELPCILELLKQVKITDLTAIIIDGYVYLDDNDKIGLGGYLYQAINQSVAVIGVAKKPFHDNKKNVVPIYRGNSKHPLFITAIGINVEQAANDVQSMHGQYRFPTLLSLLDQQTKDFR